MQYVAYVRWPMDNPATGGTGFEVACQAVDHQAGPMQRDDFVLSPLAGHGERIFPHNCIRWSKTLITDFDFPPVRSVMPRPYDDPPPHNWSLAPISIRPRIPTKSSKN